MFDDDDEIELDPATELWDGENSEIEGGINYADEDL